MGASDRILVVTHWIYQTPVTVSSNYARANAREIAAAASLGYITTRTAFDEFGSLWRATAAGITQLQHAEIL